MSRVSSVAPKMCLETEWTLYELCVFSGHTLLEEDAKKNQVLTRRSFSLQYHPFFFFFDSCQLCLMVFL